MIHSRIMFIRLNFLGLALTVAPAVRAAEIEHIAVEIHKAKGPIVVDGDLSDEGWKDAARVDTWFETNPGDNVEPKVKNVAWLTYDDKFFYAAFEFSDPDPRKIRAPFCGPRQRRQRHRLRRRDPRHAQRRQDGRPVPREPARHPVRRRPRRHHRQRGPVARLLLGLGGTHHGRRLDPRDPHPVLLAPLPQGAIRRPGASCSTATTRAPTAIRCSRTHLPRGGNCFICNANKLTGLVGAPRRAATSCSPLREREQDGEPRRGRPRHAAAGTKPLDGDGRARREVDARRPSTALDATINPDFSQIESDVAQICVQRALRALLPREASLLPRRDRAASRRRCRRSTRARSRRRAGGRTSRASWTRRPTRRSSRRTAAAGSVVLPGPNVLGLRRPGLPVGRRHRPRAPRPRALVRELPRDEPRDRRGRPQPRLRPRLPVAAGHRRHRHGPVPVERQPDAGAARPRRRSGTADASRDTRFETWWQHSTRHVDGFTEYRDFTDGFRADDGFVPAGRIPRGAPGSTATPSARRGSCTRFRPFAGFDYQEGQRRGRDPAPVLGRRRHGRTLELPRPAPATRSTTCARATSCSRAASCTTT